MALSRHVCFGICKQKFEVPFGAMSVVLIGAFCGSAMGAAPDIGGAPTLTDTDVFVSRGAVRDIAEVDLIPLRGASSPIFVITDTTVDALYGDAFVSGLRQRGHAVERIVMADGEASKSLANYAALVERILRFGIDQNSVLISLGGGAVCNVCGFVASTLYRGVELVVAMGNDLGAAGAQPCRLNEIGGTGLFRAEFMVKHLRSAA